MRQTCIGYWGIHGGKSQSVSLYGLPALDPLDSPNNTEQCPEASGVGRSWVQSMFSRERAISFTRSGKWTSDCGSFGSFGA